jgi:hypothetical protein
MRNVFVVLLINCSALISNAQNWCTPNSEWHYNHASFSGPGYAKISYTGTTTVNSYACQQLSYFAMDYNFSAGFTSTTTLNYYTYENNSVVYLYNRITQVFDTLYNYNAAIGNQWLLPTNLPTTTIPACAKAKLIVLDTGRATIQSTDLKWLKVQINYPSYIVTDTIFERIGFLNNYFFSADYCTIEQDYNEGGALRCFSDGSGFNYNRTAKPCTDLYNPVGLGALKIKDKRFKIYPNPSNGLLKIQIEDATISNYNLKLVNVLGQEETTDEVLKQNDIVTLNIQGLKKGIYFLQVFYKGKLIFTEKIIKE